VVVNTARTSMMIKSHLPMQMKVRQNFKVLLIQLCLEKRLCAPISWITSLT